MNQAEWLLRSARLKPDAPALFKGERNLCSYRELAEAVGSAAGVLQSRFGVIQGDRVVLLMRNRPEYLTLMYAVWWLGAAIAPLNYKLHPEECAWIIADCEAKVIVADESLANELQPQLLRRSTQLTIPEALSEHRRDTFYPPVSREPADLAWLFYTSGTTGRPKGVMLSHANLMAMSLAYLSDVDEVSADDVALYGAPMSHGAGLYSMVHVLRGARHVIPDSGGFDAAEVLALALAMKRVSLFAAPTMVRRLVDQARSHPIPGEGLKTVVYGGGPMYMADIVDAVNVMGPRFVQIYGQGESPMTITALSRELVADRSHPAWEQRLASVGRAHACVQVRTATEDGQWAEPGQLGEVCVRGATVMQGYWNRPDATAETLKGGWLRTGDLGVLDHDGFLTLKDRSKDVIICGASNIYPREVEEVLLTHPAVRECAVVGRADPEWGETVVAFIVTTPGAALDCGELDSLCLSRIARFKRPRTYRLVDTLPKNNYGKVLKTQLRAQLREEDGGTAGGGREAF